MKNKNIIGIVFVACIIFSSFYVSATVGVTSFYYDDNPLYVHAGETKEIAFVLQNNGEGTDAIVKVVPNQNMVVGEFVDEDLEYDVPLGSNGIQVPVIINIPENSQINDEWTVGAAFQIFYDSDGSEGGLQLSTTYMRDFKVIVGEKPVPSSVEEETFSLLSLVYLLIILIIIIFVVKLLSRKKK